MKVLLLAHHNTGNVLSLAAELGKEMDLTLCYIVSGERFVSGIVDADITHLSMGLNTNEEANLSILSPPVREFVQGSFRFWTIRMPDKKFLRDKKLRNYRAVRRAIQGLKEENFDVIHINGESNALFYLRGYLNSKPLAWTIHDFVHHSGELQKTALKVRNYLMKKFSAAEYVQHYSHLKDEFIAHSDIPAERVHHMYTGKLNVYQNFLKKDAESLVKGRYILFFGRVSKYKGIDYLLEAWEETRKHFPDMKLVLAGKGKLWFDQEKFNSDQVVWLHRYIENHELSRLIMDSEFVIAPYTDATHSAVVMTAFAFDKPVLSTNVGGLPEVVREGITGWTIAPKSTEALKEKLNELLSNSNAIRDGQASIGKLEESAKELDWSFIRKQYVRLYQDMIKSSKS